MHTSRSTSSLHMQTNSPILIAKKDLATTVWTVVSTSSRSTDVYDFVVPIRLVVLVISYQTRAGAESELIKLGLIVDTIVGLLIYRPKQMDLNKTPETDERI
ncbi:hypothetical protein FRX31_024363 [Thalictrum thalictroides]|uniref:Uncharacterized protein n=1 Tax=Thalictrum thalictroides TaxID=46969 RepID=A0A7J6VM94_THATH|nr:hypothetical protein FRX31_024363 [Thalictrum thalictroides]